MISGKAVQFLPARDAGYRFRGLPLRKAALTVTRAVHTGIWLGVESCMGYVIYAGLTGRSDRRTAIAAAVVGGESLIFLGSGCRCPLTGLAERCGATSGSVTDIYLPHWFATNLPKIHVPLIGLAIYLHARIAVRRDRG